MLGLPQKGIVRTDDCIADTGTLTPGVSVTTGAAATTKGTPAELIASTPFDTYYLIVTASDYANAGTACQGAMDILIGAATEEVLIPNLLFGHAGFHGNATVGAGPKRWDFPIHIPAGTRISVQACGARTSTAFRVQVYLHGGNGYPPFRVGSKVTTYGLSTLPRGTSITPGSTGAAGSWTQITASTSEDHFAFAPSFQVATDATVTSVMHTVEMGIGSATEEKIGFTYIFSSDSNERQQGPINSFPSFADVPSGTRLVMRASCSGSNDAAYDCMIHAVS